MEEPDLKKCNKLNVEKRETGHTIIRYIDYGGKTIGEDILDDDGNTVSSGKYPSAPIAPDLEVNAAYRWYLQYCGTHDCPQCQKAVHDPGAINKLAAEDIMAYYKASIENNINPVIWCCGCSDEREYVQQYLSGESRGSDSDAKYELACKFLRTGNITRLSAARTKAYDYLKFREDISSLMLKRRIRIQEARDKDIDFDFLGKSNMQIREEIDKQLEIRKWKDVEPFFLPYSMAYLTGIGVTIDETAENYEIMINAQVRILEDRQKLDSIKTLLERFEDWSHDVHATNEGIDYSKISQMITNAITNTSTIQTGNNPNVFQTITLEEQYSVYDCCPYMYNRDEAACSTGWDLNTNPTVYHNGVILSNDRLREICEHMIRMGFLYKCYNNTYCQVSGGSRP